jgi:hypothetical protein
MYVITQRSFRSIYCDGLLLVYLLSASSDEIFQEFVLYRANSFFLWMDHSGGQRSINVYFRARPDIFCLHICRSYYHGHRLVQDISVRSLYCWFIDRGVCHDFRRPSPGQVRFAYPDAGSMCAARAGGTLDEPGQQSAGTIYRLCYDTNIGTGRSDTCTIHSDISMVHSEPWESHRYRQSWRRVERCDVFQS